MNKITDKELLELKKEVHEIIKNDEKLVASNKPYNEEERWFPNEANLVDLVDEIEDSTVEYIFLRAVKETVLASPIQAKTQKEYLKQERERWNTVREGIAEKLGIEHSTNVTRIYNITYRKLLELYEARIEKKRRKFSKNVLKTTQDDPKKALKLLADNFGVSEEELKNAFIKYSASLTEKEKEQPVIYGGYGYTESGKKRMNIFMIDWLFDIDEVSLNFHLNLSSFPLGEYIDTFLLAVPDIISEYKEDTISPSTLS